MAETPVDWTTFMQRDAGNGGVLGTNQFVGEFTESVWVATFTFFIIWLLSLFISPISEAIISMSKPESRKEHPPRAIRNFTRASRDAFLILLATTLATQSGYGINYNNVALTWTIFALLVVWVLLHTLLPVAMEYLWWADMLVFLPILGLAIANFALAFTNAPSSR